MNNKQRKNKPTRTSTKSQQNDWFEEMPLFKLLEEIERESESSQNGTVNINNRKEKQLSTRKQP